MKIDRKELEKQLTSIGVYSKGDPSATINLSVDWIIEVIKLAIKGLETK